MAVPGPGRPLLAAAAAGVLALAGCGADSTKSDAAATRAYARDIDAFCADVQRATHRFQASAERLGGETDRRAAARSFGAALGRLADGFDAGAGRLRAAAPPKRYRTSMGEAVRVLDASAVRLRGAARTVRSGDADDLRRVASGLGDLRVPQAPQDLVAQAPSCR